MRWRRRRREEPEGSRPKRSLFRTVLGAAWWLLSSKVAVDLDLADRRRRDDDPPPDPQIDRHLEYRDRYLY